MRLEPPLSNRCKSALRGKTEYSIPHVHDSERLTQIVDGCSIRTNAAFRNGPPLLTELFQSGTSPRLSRHTRGPPSIAHAHCSFDTTLLHFFIPRLIFDAILLACSFSGPLAMTRPVSQLENYAVARYGSPEAIGVAMHVIIHTRCLMFRNSCGNGLRAPCSLLMALVGRQLVYSIIAKSRSLQG